MYRVSGPNRSEAAADLLLELQFATVGQVIFLSLLHFPELSLQRVNFTPERLVFCS
jgi:hypothetical protein